MTKLGLLFAKKSISKSEVAKKTGLNKSRISDLTLKSSAHLRGDELYLIALAIDMNPHDLLDYLYSDLKLKAE